jgi:prevent-host-death family protein
MMRQVNMLEAKTALSELVAAALRGEEVVIARANKPVVRLVPVEPVLRVRRLGWAAGKVRVAADFDAPLDAFANYR